MDGINIISNNFSSLSLPELNCVNAGCWVCYAGAILVIAGGFLCGGILGGVIAIAGVATVILLIK